ncbi:MAG: tRNA dihydrouridine synthase DusB [Leptolyngbyaceae cyanobacterium MAG.088]|nr:tRNA dihydrouridine synthase DusB [Leptolyngbyaceae cyanobacterium MAG.088]
MSVSINLDQVSHHSSSAKHPPRSPLTTHYSLTPALKARLATPLKIGTVEVQSRVLQSPLSGVTDLVFRRLVRRYAPQSMMYTEMVSAAELHHMRKLPKVMEVDPDERPISIQLFDRRPEFLAEAAKKAVDQGADTIDINMGCPVNKITKNGGGSSLLKDPDNAARIIETVSTAVSVPVTAKTRIGWSENDINAVKFARRLESAGIQMLTLHGRTRSQGYNGTADWSWIAKVKQALSVPVIANGDIFSVDAAINCLEQTQADGVMCSRGTLGYPFLVGEIDHFLKTGKHLPPPTIVERLRCAQEHLVMLAEYKGKSGIRQARKHMAWYAKGFDGAAELREKLCRIESVEEGCGLLEQVITVISPQLCSHSYRKTAIV